jgi:hypothetical protein
MIDHEFSTYFMFPDNPQENIRWFGELQRSISGEPVKEGEYDFMINPVERELMKKSAVALHNNLLYIREHFPNVTQDFLNKLSRFEADLKNHSDELMLKKEPDYPDTANSNAWLIGKARYKDMNESLAIKYEEKYRNAYKTIDFNRVNIVARSEIELVIAELRNQLCQTSV